MSRPIAELVAHRVNALAYVALTRRDDIIVVNIAEQGELDLLARVTPPRARQVRFLGVILRGTIKILTTEGAARELHTYFRQAGKDRGPVQYPFPVIALIFSMENDEGFVAWRSEPVLAKTPQPRLELKQSLTCQSFTKAVLDEVVERTNEWYDALFSFFAQD
jgi:hypothetical protein